jgi:phospholipid transport system transporter-binding protein
MQIKAKFIKVGNGQQVIAEVCRAVEQGDTVIDFSNVESVDSTALAVILAARRVQKKGASALELVHPPAQLQALVAAYGVQSLF